MARKQKNINEHSAIRKRRVNHFFTYLYMVILAIIIIYPVLITVSSAFKAGNVQSFTLDFNSKWTLNNFHRLFAETLYGTW